MKSSKNYKDADGNVLLSDYVDYKENPEYIIDYTYNDWLLSPEEYYKRILKENQELERQNWNY